MRYGVQDAFNRGREVEARVLMTMNQPLADFMNLVLRDPSAFVSENLRGHEWQFPRLDEAKKSVTEWRCACNKRREMNANLGFGVKALQENPFLHSARSALWNDEA